MELVSVDWKVGYSKETLKGGGKMTPIYRIEWSTPTLVIAVMECDNGFEALDSETDSGLSILSRKR